MKPLLYALLILVCAAPVFAHNPRGEVTDWGNFDDPYVIEDGAVSFAFFGALADENDLDVFRVDFAEPESTLRLKLFVPVCEGDEPTAEFFPQVLILHTEEGAEDPITSLLPLLTDGESAPLPTQEAPDAAAELERIGSLPADLHLLERYETTPVGEDGARAFEYESHTRRDYYDAPQLDLTLEKAGSYYLVIFAPGEGGSYLLSTGYEETFFPPLPSEPEDVTMRYESVWLTEGCE